MFRLIALLTVALAFAAIACGGGTTVINSNQTSPGITVAGEGKVSGTPDVAIVTLGAEANAKTVAAARDDAAGSMNAMLKALKDGGVADKDVQTTRFTVQPQYDYTKQQQTITGFTVSNIATVKIRAIDKTGELVDAAVTAGGDQARVENLVFTIDDPSALQSQAREKAMADAKQKADALAKAGGVQIGKPRSINESGAVTPIQYDAATFQSLAAAPSTQIRSAN